MRPVSVVILAGVLAGPAVLATACAPDAPEAVVHANRAATLRIEGMTCASCSVTVRVAAQRLEGVGDVEVDVEAGSARVAYDGGRVTSEQIARAVTEAGYTATVLSDEEA